MIIMIKFRYRADSPPLHMLPKMTVPELLKNSSQLQIPQYRLELFGISKNNESKRNKQKCEKKKEEGAQVAQVTMAESSLDGADKI